MGIPTDRPIIKGRLLEDSVVEVTPLVTTLEAVTVKPAGNPPPVKAEEREEVAEVAADAEVVELPLDGSATPPT